MNKSEIILAIHTGHDASVCLWKDYEQVAIYKEERLNRKKNWGKSFPILSFQKIKDHINLENIDVLVLSRGYFENKFFYKKPFIANKISRLLLYLFPFFKKNRYESLSGLLFINNLSDEKKVLNLNKFLKAHGMRKNVKVKFSDHHYAHALPTLFYNPKWDNALLYTSDGGGDGTNYSFTYFNNNKLKVIYGYSDLLREDFKPDSVGQMYSLATEICGFIPNRHEGKITGLAAFGEPKYANDIISLYEINDIGRILPKFKNYKKLKDFLAEIYINDGREVLAASVQNALEYLTVKSIEILKNNHAFANIGLAGGVCSNVKLNQKISEIVGIDDIFIFPAMGDEGLIIGYVLDYLLERDGIINWLDHRVELENIYWGDEFKVDISDIPNELEVYTSRDILATSVKLLNDNKVCAIFSEKMEYGPRALGARSIIINSSDRTINKSVNKRLDRTEFMPFAPYVLEEMVDKVFKISKQQKKSLKFMTMTVDVRDEWKEKIQATVHIDGTARPQTVNESQNKLYYLILKEFYEVTGVPCLVNTSFNAHEEPIINTPQEAFEALINKRVDYIIFDKFIVTNKNEK